MARPRKKHIEPPRPAPGRVEEIIEEAVKTNSISIITNAERYEIAERYARITGLSLNVWCNACIMEACFTIYNNRYNNTKRF